MQGETGDRRRFGGIGLGLYIVRQLARAQDGEVAADEREGGGTVMRLRAAPRGRGDDHPGAAGDRPGAKADRPAAAAPQPPAALSAGGYPAARAGTAPA